MGAARSPRPCPSPSTDVPSTPDGTLHPRQHPTAGDRTRPPRTTANPPVPGPTGTKWGWAQGPRARMVWTSRREGWAHRPEPRHPRSAVSRGRGHNREVRRVSTPFRPSPSLTRPGHAGGGPGGRPVADVHGDRHGARRTRPPGQRAGLRGEPARDPDPGSRDHPRRTRRRGCGGRPASLGGLRGGDGPRGRQDQLRARGQGRGRLHPARRRRMAGGRPGAIGVAPRPRDGWPDGRQRAGDRLDRRGHRPPAERRPRLAGSRHRVTGSGVVRGSRGRPGGRPASPCDGCRLCRAAAHGRLRPRGGLRAQPPGVRLPALLGAVGRLEQAQLQHAVHHRLLLRGCRFQGQPAQEEQRRDQHHRMGRLDQLVPDVRDHQRACTRHARGPDPERVRMDELPAHRPEGPAGLLHRAPEPRPAGRRRRSRPRGRRHQPGLRAAGQHLLGRVRGAAQDGPRRAQQGPLRLSAHV